MIFRDAPLIVWGATILHVIIGSLLLLYPDAGKSTGPAAVVDLFTITPAGIIMLASSVLAVAAIVLRRGGNRLHLALVLPQQALLYIAAFGGLAAVLEGEYADGVTRPYEFILTDQLPIMLLALLHTLAVVEMPWRDS